ncbi:MAG: hypothetical protein KDB71_06085, partial [Mycobacterium sp.]|nr:hypothetical protein [Mycobacterium sp.]
GDPVPSARFMGGREFDTIMAGADPDWQQRDLQAVLSSSQMFLPSMELGTGPYPTRQGGWMGGEPAGGRRKVAASFYLALMTATCLDLAGAEGEIIVEGPFASSRPYLLMLSAATSRLVKRQQTQGTGTSIGAAMLAGGRRTVEADPQLPTDSINRAAMGRYAQIWGHAVSAGPEADRKVLDR